MRVLPSQNPPDSTPPVDMLFAQTFVDQTRLVDNIRAVLPERSAALLSDIVAMYPLEQGAAEIVSYLALDDGDVAVEMDDSDETVLRLRRSGKPDHCQAGPAAEGDGEAPMSDEHAVASAIIRLMQGVIYRESDEGTWTTLERSGAGVRDHFATIGVDVVVDQDEGYAFLRTRPDVDGEEALPRLVRRRTLTYSVSLLLVLLRKRLIEFETSGSEGGLVLTTEQIVEMLRLSGILGRHALERHDGHVVDVTRLVTFVEVDDTVADPWQMSVSARREAVLMNGGRVLLLADRGWSVSGPPNIWAVTSVEEIADTARMVVRPDKPFGGREQGA